MKKNDFVKSKVEGYTAEGSGVIRVDGYPVFVPHAAKGDEGTFRILKTNKTYGFGKIEALEIFGDGRRTPLCPVYGTCGGCAVMHLTAKEQLSFKTEKVRSAMERIGGFSGDIVKEAEGGEEFRYRNKAQFPLKNARNGVTFGFFAPRSHRVVECEDCLLQPEIANRMAGAVCDWMNHAGVRAYDEETGKGHLRHIFTRVGFGSKNVQVTLVVNGASLPEEDSLVEALLACAGDWRLTGVILNENTRRDNVILGNQWRTLYGDAYFEDVLCGKTFRISPAAFYQVNHEVCEKMYERAKELAQLTGEETVFDLYCGAGTIGLSMAEGAKELIGVEIVPEAVENAKRNAELNGIKNAHFYAGRAEEVVPALYKEGARADVVILDPPRKGCDRTLLGTVGKMNPQRIVYVSCDAATLARDAKILTEYGYYPKVVYPYDQFPQTSHTEAVCLLEKTENLKV